MQVVTVFVAQRIIIKLLTRKMVTPSEILDVCGRDSAPKLSLKPACTTGIKVFLKGAKVTVTIGILKFSLSMIVWREIGALPSMELLFSKSRKCTFHNQRGTCLFKDLSTMVFNF